MTDVLAVALIILGVLGYLLVAQALTAHQARGDRERVRAQGRAASRRIRRINDEAQADILRLLARRRGPRP